MGLNLASSINCPLKTCTGTDYEGGGGVSGEGKCGGVPPGFAPVSLVDSTPLGVRKEPFLLFTNPA